jgi:NAD(P)-dependent dehydrogenase (short-subunit alcohol dehydrogenase family)
MDLEFKGKVALITGAGQGVGREIARVLAAEGASVVVNDFYKERAEAVASEISKTGARALGIQCDVTDRDQVKTMMSKAVEAFGPVDILVNNAGVPVQVRSGEMKRTYFVDIDPANWRKISSFFLRMPDLYCSVLPSMIEERGRIINIIQRR